MNARLNYTGIRVKDLAKPVDFYTKVLSMTEVARSRIPESRRGAVQLTSEKGGPVLASNFYERGSRFATPYSPGRGLDHLAFKVSDPASLLAAAKEADAPPLLEMRSGDTRWVYIEDPNGLWTEVFT